MTKQQKDHISTQLALANIGLQRYGNPKIVYKGKSYHASQLIKVLEKQQPLSLEDLVTCKTIKYLLEEKLNELGVADNYEIEDEVLRAYATVLRQDICRVKYLIKKSNI